MCISLPSRSAEAKMKRLKSAVCYIPNRWEKMRSICSRTEITEVILSMIKDALQQFRMPLLRDIQQKEN